MTKEELRTIIICSIHEAINGEVTANQSIDFIVENVNSKIEDLEEIIDSQEEDINFLRALEAAGVDNWEGYDIAQDYM